jgi:hypothetical protein
VASARKRSGTLAPAGRRPALDSLLGLTQQAGHAGTKHRQLSAQPPTLEGHDRINDTRG